MIKIFKSLAGHVSMSEPEKGCWINVLEPTPQEINQLTSVYNIPEDIIGDILDVDERPRVEYDDDWTLIIFRIPVANSTNGVPYQTVPLGIFITTQFTLTLCSTKNEVLSFEYPTLYREKKQPVSDVLNFLFRLSLKSSQTFLKFLKHINQQTALIEQDLEKSIRNKELNKLLKMEKCLVYFITSLKANEMVLAKLGNAKKNTISEINEDLLEDAIIENKQALEISMIYSDIQSGMMDAFASVISNNLNVVMKQLASISIILMIPTLIASMYGMNVINYWEEAPWAFPVIIVSSLFLSIIGILIFRKRDWF
ncbi:magnesium transporter CorA family protein [Prolixibacteraceae bacterium Z1-6]|uniref:Magnesium transporter CorA family protein n=1 Tax=Draconibacterium aestuarii TaxID=2998507 RepID=A0A9X3FB40_9BACT|nr:magnesium transporter CorA family protein [Prolixibacteraceae bacterium Z1-6]